MINVDEFPFVRSFFSAYLHQDWKYEYESLDEALDDYCSCGDISDRKKAVKELEKLFDLARKGEFSESDLLLFSCYFLPSVHNMTVTEWLNYLVKFVKGRVS